MVVTEGDLVYDECLGVDDGTGIVLEVRRDVEIPPSVTILWSNGTISNTWCDDICLVKREEEHAREETVDPACHI